MGKYAAVYNYINISILLLNIYSKGIKIDAKEFVQKSMVVLTIISRKHNQPICSSAKECINKMWYIQK